MSAQLLELRSPAILLDVDEDGPLYSASIDEWTVAEHRFLGAREDPPVAGNYRVTISRDVSGMDAGSAFIHGEALARALERAWLYGTGAMLSGRGYEFFLTPATLPQEWSSNAKDVVPTDDWKLLSAGAYLGPLRRHAQKLPLRECVAILWALAGAEDIPIQLVTYHVGAVTSRDSDLTMLLFAQGLEMGRSLLSGKTKAERVDSLPIGVRDRLPRDLDWYFEVSNQRRSTRHAIDKKGAIALKPDFDDEEAHDFRVGASILLHYLVTRALGVPLILAEDGRSVHIPAA